MVSRKDIRDHWLFKLYRPFPGWKQTGGAYITIRSNKIHYRITNDDFGTTFLGGEGAGSPCFTLEIPKDKPTVAVLQEVLSRDTCFEPRSNDSRDIVRAAYKLAQQRGVKTLEFTDISHIHCPEKVRLADLSFLTTGKTWYESILPQAKCTDMSLIEEYREKVRSNTWRQVGHDLIDVDIDGVDIDGVDIDEPGSAMLVLNTMKKTKDFCWFFAEYMDKLLYRSGIQSLIFSSWVCEVRPISRSITPRSRRSSRMTQKRR